MTKFWSGLERYILVAKFLVLIFGRSHEKLQRGSWYHSALL